MLPAPINPFAERLRALVAGGCVALVLALSVFAASPAAHNWLHVDAGPSGHDDGCAVVLFAGGVSLPLGPIAVPQPRVVALAESAPAVAEILLMSPRYLRQPERGPPAVG